MKLVSYPILLGLNVASCAALQSVELNAAEAGSAFDVSIASRWPDVVTWAALIVALLVIVGCLGFKVLDWMLDWLHRDMLKEAEKTLADRRGE